MTMNKVKNFKSVKRNNHHFNSLQEKKAVCHFLKSRNVSITKNMVIYDTTGFNITDNYYEYMEAGFRDMTLYCVERDKSLLPAMTNKKQRDKIHDAHIIHGDIFEKVLQSKLKIKHINFDGTQAIQTLLKNGLMKKIEQIITSNVVTCSFTFQLLYDIGSSKKFYRKHEMQILTDLFIEIEELAETLGYRTQLVYNKRFNDGKRTMQSLVIGFTA